MVLSPARRWIPRGYPLPDDVWNSRHRGFVILLLMHSVGLTAFGIVRGYGVVHSILESSVPVVAAVAATLFRGRTAKSMIATFGLLSTSGILVHMSGGTIEAHFHFFVMVTLITLYQSWAPFLLSIVYVVLHHGVLGTIDPRAVYNHAAAIERPFTWAAIHGIFVFAASVAGLIVWKRNEDLRLREQAQALELNDTVVQGLVAAKLSLELETPKAQTAALVEGTLQQAQTIVSKIIRESSGARGWEAGDFVRAQESTIENGAAHRDSSAAVG